MHCSSQDIMWVQVSVCLQKGMQKQQTATYVVSEKRILFYSCETKIQVLQIIVQITSCVCGTSCITAAVTNVHCLCDVSWCLAMVQERLQRSFSQMGMRTLIKFHVLLGKTALECYKSLKESLGTHTPPRKNVHQ